MGKSVMVNQIHQEMPISPISVVNEYKKENRKLSPTIQLNNSKQELHEPDDLDSPSSPSKGLNTHNYNTHTNSVEKLNFKVHEL